MKIISIEINKESSLMKVGERKLQGVILKTKNWIGNIKEMKAFPTNYGPTYGSERILYFCFADENGIELEDNISKQINNFLLNQEMNGKF